MQRAHEGKKLTAAVRFLSCRPPRVRAPLGADDVEAGAGEAGAGCAVRHRLAELEPAVLDLVLSCTAAEVPHALQEAADRASGRASRADPPRPHRAALPELGRQLGEVEALAMTRRR